MEIITTSFLLGLSLGNVWICALMVFALETTDKRLSIGYLVGRFAGVLLFAATFWAIGRVVAPPQPVMNIISGVMLLGFAAYFFAKHGMGWIGHRRGDHHHGDHEHQHGSRGVDHAGCTHDCASCPAAGHEDYSGFCDDCSDDPTCSAEDPQVEPLTRMARQSWGRDVSRSGASGFIAGIVLGLVRGSAMCGRLVVLLPLVMGATFLAAMSAGASFAFSSSIYPIMAFVASRHILKLVARRKLVFSISAAMLAAVGVYYVVRGVIQAA